MAAPRASSFKALSKLQRASSSVPAKRNLHITGANSFPRPLEPVHKHTYAPLSMQDLRNECRKRSLTPSGTKHELVDRLAIHDGLQARAFSIAMKRIAGEQPKKQAANRSANDVPSRHFNTSRVMKAVRDSSTIDFAYMPSIDYSLDDSPTAIRVPILPHIESDDAQAILSHHELDAAAGGLEDAEHPPVMKPEIVTVTETMADGAHVDLDFSGHASAMSEVQDNHGTEMSVDALTDLADTVGKSARKIVDKAPEIGTVRQVWNGLLDDLFGEKRGPRLS